MIACISNEYAQSENCMKEFRFASNLKVPIIICTFGSARRKSEWKNTELGIISCLNNKEINFQLENKSAFIDLLNEIKSLQIVPVNQILKDVIQEYVSELSEPIETKMAYVELIELAQRKFLRQIANFADTAASRPFPRLFVIDLFVDLEAINKQKPKLNQSMPIDYSGSSSGTEKAAKFCIRAMCECESGWHTNGKQLEYEQLTSIPESHYAYLFRIMSLIKIMSLNLDILSNVDKLEELIDYIDEHLPNNSSDETNINARDLSANIVQYRSQRTRNPAVPEIVLNFKESYNSIKAYLINLLDQNKLNSLAANTAFSKNEDTSNSKIILNLNRVDHFGLNRCLMPSGKITWLCDEHSREEHVQVLTSTQEKNVAQYQSNEFNKLLFEELKKFDI